MTAALRFNNLTLGYDRHPAVHHLDGAVDTGALMAVVGPNGAGKSTLFKGIVGMIKPLAGRIERGGLAARDIAYLPQAAEIDRSFPINVFDMVAMGLWHHTGLFGGIDRKARHRVEEAIAAVGLTGFEDRAIGTLSGGQMQRMLFARLLLQDARVIVLDEPFNAVDAKTSADLFDLVRRWHGEKRTVLDRAARHRFRAREFPGDAAARARAGGLGQHGDRADAGKSADRAAHVRGLRRARGRMRRANGCGLNRIDHVRLALRPLHRVRVHAPRAGRHDRAGARRRSDRRVPDAAPHEPGRRRHGACDPARAPRSASWSPD